MAILIASLKSSLLYQTHYNQTDIIHQLVFLSPSFQCLHHDKVSTYWQVTSIVGLQNTDDFVVLEYPPEPIRTNYYVL